MAAKRTIPKGKGVAPPFWTQGLTNLDGLTRWRRKVLADSALGRWKENLSKLATTDSANWNLVKSVYAPRSLTSPMLVVNGHPLAKRQ
ncbi:uncharacterized protein TEOVI_000173300 [Trypanosoma equiperdum]|uniref:Uncharacterized protein n=1 Tax=Trypanosoma equiperdum TaxID=5694 RepID=A0A1G4IDL7_TRYEQ|nr:hypothetical protein TEOVI_000173300 [Trypanosoma equiperdum]